MRYLLNSAVVTAPGRYTYRLVTPQEAREWAARGPYASTLGYAETAALASEILGVPVPVDRRVIRMAPGDEALVIRLALPPGSPRIDPADKGRLGQAVLAGHVELGVLTREDDPQPGAEASWRPLVRQARDLLAASRDAFRSRQVQRARELLEQALG